MIVVDSHMHVNFNGWSLSDLIKYLDSHKIDRCWLLTWEEINPGPWDYQHVSVEDIYEAYLEYPSRIIPFYAPDPHRNDAAVQLENWHQNGIRGCGELKATLRWDSERVRSILKTAGRVKMPLVFHMGPVSFSLTGRNVVYRMAHRVRQKALRLLVKGCAPLRTLEKTIRSYAFPGYMLDFPSLEIALRDFPDVNFVAHGLMFWKHISTDATIHKEAYPKGPVVGEGIIWRLLRDYPNLYADTSATSGLNALARDPANAKEFLTLFEDKILYGTDNLVSGQREFIDSLGLPKRTCNKIYGENACRLIDG